MNDKNLIGKRVKHRNTNAIGIVTLCLDGVIKVDFSGKVVVFSYPAAFSTTLILEDVELQRELEADSSTAAFDDLKKHYSISLNNEIRYLKDTGGKHYRAMDGEHLQSQNGDYIYAFDTDSELHFPDGTPIKIYYGEFITSAYVVSCEEFTIIIRSKEYLGETVESIEFTAEQWKLLEALKERLYEMHPEVNSIAYELACRGRVKIDERQSIKYGQSYALRRATSEAITFIWGPPGTGKTHTLANIALEYINHGKRVLMLSYSNVSVDGALLRVGHMADCKPGQVIRYGYPRVKELLDSKTLTSYQFVLYQNPELEDVFRTLNAEKRKMNRKDPKRIEINKQLNKIRENLIEKEKELIQNAAFVATTVSKAVIDKAIFSQSFDVVIFDEASMAYVPQVVFAGGLAKSNFVCLGDFRQLPAIVQNNQEMRLAEDIFEYTGITLAVESDYGHEWLVMLNVQYRMHPDIANFVGKQMYGARLKTASEIGERRQVIADCKPLTSEAMSLIDLSYMYSVCIKTMDGSRINLLSALVCAKLAELFADKYEVGIITPYNAQSRLILALIRDLQERNDKFTNINCATVHQFQGSEKPVIIYDAVDCFRMSYPGTLLTSLKNDTANRLFNVALTRAQGKFILVANRDFLLRKKISKKLIFTKFLEVMYRKDKILNGNDAIREWSTKENENSEIFVTDKEDSWDIYLNDIAMAKIQIHIDIPGVIDDDDDAIGELGLILDNMVQQGVKVVIRTDENIFLPPALQPYITTYPYVTTPFTIIDKKKVWFGQPLSAADFVTEGDLLETEYFPCFRFEGIHTARALQAYYDI